MVAEKNFYLYKLIISLIALNTMQFNGLIHEDSLMSESRNSLHSR